jgi:hypothetical protein
MGSILTSIPPNYTTSVEQAPFEMKGRIQKNCCCVEMNDFESESSVLFSNGSCLVEEDSAG